MNVTVHYMGYGMTPCQMPTPPVTWPDNHRWSSEWAEVNCATCLLGKEWAENNICTYIRAADCSAIKCLHCGRVSHNRNDAENEYCGNCHVFHDDIWPPARRWWIEHPEPNRRKMFS